ncbi:MAG: GNAT family N-acetyltransferase [Opitutus sp.]|nr:GNAT family N-acetyltransferase [Opitutus sp.]
MNRPIEPLPTPPTAADLADLSALLRDAVEGGASIGFMLPLADAEVAAFWADVLAEVAANQRVLLVARAAGRLVGSVQLELAQRPNSRHRAELQKLLVLRAHRSRGLGAALLAAAEDHARRHQRSLVVLDTSASGNALGLYARGGYTRVGVIPRYATDPDGPLIDTVIYYKELSAA